MSISRKYCLPAELKGKTMTLKEYLNLLGISAAQFAKERAKLDKNTILKAYHGRKIRIDTAKRIYRCTNKVVSLESLGYK